LVAGSGKDYPPEITIISGEQPRRNLKREAIIPLDNDLNYK